MIYYKQLTFFMTVDGIKHTKNFSFLLFFHKFSLWITCVKCDLYQTNPVELAYTPVSY